MLGPCATPLLRYPRKAAVGHHEPRARNHRRTLSHRGRHPRKTARRTIGGSPGAGRAHRDGLICRSEEHTSELQSLMRISYAVFCLKKKHKQLTTQKTTDIIR